MQERAQTVDVRLRRGLHPAILFGGRVARRAKGHGILRFAWTKVAGNPKIDQIDLPPRCTHDIARLEIAEDDSWLAGMQIVQHGAKLEADSQCFAQR